MCKKYNLELCLGSKVERQNDKERKQEIENRKVLIEGALMSQNEG